MAAATGRRRPSKRWPPARWAALAALLLATGALGAWPLLGAQAAVAAGAVFVRAMPTAILNDQTHSMSVGVDSAGGMHAAFVNASTDTNGDYHAYYDYCAPGADCGSAAHWTLVNLMTISSSVTIMEESQLAVNAQGHPRLIIVTTDNGDPFMDHYSYAACDSACTNRANWTITDVADTDSGVNVFIGQANKHFFALDPQGRPRFVLDNGTNYVYNVCNSGCANKANWSALTLNGPSDTGTGYNTPALAFNASGQPRMLAPISTGFFQSDLHYWECSANDCATNADSWTDVAVISPFSGDAAAYSSLRLTHTGQPRFAYYGKPGGAAETLYYYSCNSACTTGAHWSHTSIGLAPEADFNSSGQEPDLALDSQDEPRLSFQTLDNTLGHGLGYAYCNQGCEAGGTSWQKRVADSNDQLNADWNRLPPAGCTFSSWIGGYRSSLVLDKAGNPRIGYDAQHFSGNCLDPGLVGSDYTTVRFVFFPGTSVPGPYRLYLPLSLR